MDAAWLQTRIDNTKLLIEKYETALLAISTGTQQSYTLDTGQTRQTVTNKNLTTLQDAINSAYNLLAVLLARRNGAAGQGRPGW